LANLVSVVLAEAAGIPVALAISEAVIGPRPFSASRILALLWPRGARAGPGACSAAAGRLARGRLGRGWVSAAEARHECALKIRNDVAQALELIGEPLVLAELIFDLLEPRFDLVDDHADIPTSWHLTPALDCAGS
jgi:hypothetical protein